MKNSLILTVLMSVFAFGVNAQEKFKANQINLNAGVQSVDLNIKEPYLSLEFERRFLEKLSFQIGGSYNSFFGDNLMTDSLLYNTDSLRIYRNQYSYNRSFSLNAGIQYRPNPYLKFGANLILGYNRNHQSFRDVSKRYNAVDDTWYLDNDALRESFPDIYDHQRDVDQTSANFGAYYGYLKHTNYLVTGVSVNVTGCLPIGEKWEIALSAITSFSRYTYLNNNALIKELNLDGLNAYPNFENYITETPSFNLWNNILTLGVGYKF